MSLSWVALLARFNTQLSRSQWRLTRGPQTCPLWSAAGCALHFISRGRCGAAGIVIRISHNDLDHGAVRNGTFAKRRLGHNRYATRRWTSGVGWGRTWLTRFGTTGRTDSPLTSLQWLF
jgi:phosphate-selective porin OprO/OprP